MRKLWDLLRNKIGTKNLICGILGICIAVGWNVEFYCMARGFGG